MGEGLSLLHMVQTAVALLTVVLLTFAFPTSSVVLVALAVGAVTDRLTLSRDESKVLEFIDNIRNKQASLYVPGSVFTVIYCTSQLRCISSHLHIDFVLISVV